MHTDPIADLLTRMRNGRLAQHSEIHCPYSKIKHAMLNVMKEKEFITDMEVVEKGKFKELKITIDPTKQVTLKRVSTPGKRIYMKSGSLRKPLSGLGINIISTSKGVMTGEKAKEMKLGGELLCTIY